MKLVRVAVFLVLGFVMACSGQTEPIVVVETVIVEKEPPVIETVELEKIPAEPVAPRINENKIVYALDRDPEILNPYLFSRSASAEAYRLLGEGLLGVNPAGDYFPLLAAAVPSIQNGLVSADGLTVTYPLKEGVFWSDGMPFGCNDVQFTWQAVTHPESGAVNTAGYNQIAAVECPDKQTVVITFNQFYAPYRELFSAAGRHGILPQHATGPPANMQQWSYNWFPIGTGPFKLLEWTPDDHLTFVPNERYHGAQPAVDQFEIRIIPDKQAGFQWLQSGTIDVLWDINETDALHFDSGPNIVRHVAAGPGVEWLILNLANPQPGNVGDPATNPHWTLGDVRVRRAIQHAIDREAIYQAINPVNNSKPYSGWFDALTGDYNPDQAASLLTEAGWIDLDGDGIRECHNCLYTDAGRPLRLTLHTTLNNSLRRDTANQIQQMLKAVGIEIAIEYIPPVVLFGPWHSGSLRKHGRFDMLMYTIDETLNPQLQLEQLFHKNNIPTAAHGGTGTNYSRWVNNEFSHLLDVAGTRSDGEERSVVHNQALNLLSEAVPHIYLYHRYTIHLTHRRLQGFEANPWSTQTWNAASWSVGN